MKALALLALLALTGCQPLTPAGPCARTDTIYLDPRFSVFERSAIDRAADAWTRGTGICWAPTIQYETADLRLLRAETEADMLDPHPLDAVGLYAPRTRRAWVSPGASNGTRLATIVAHELGHYLGLGHQECPGIDTLMCPVIDDATPLTGEIPALDRAGVRP